MFKIKKIIIFFLLIFPFLFILFFGYPIKENSKFEILNPKKLNLNYSRRCFKVGEFKQFINCFKNHPTLNSRQLISTLNNETASLFPGFNILFFTALTLQISLLFFLI